jgi:drug/metabolite transporter (DMT)-like permease
VLAALFCTILFSVSIVCGHRTAKLIGGTEANFWRLTCATLFLGLWSFGRGVGLSGAAFPDFLLSGVIGIGIGDVALFQALPRLGSRLSLLLINCLTAPFGALLEWFWLGTALTRGQILSGLVILLGVGLALMPGKHLRFTPRQLAVGLSFCLLSALGGAGGAVLSRKAYAIAHLNAQHLGGPDAAFQRVVGGLFIAAVCLLIVKRGVLKTQTAASPQLIVEVSRKKWSAVWPFVLVNGLAGQTFGVSCMQWALETTPTGIVLAILATTPVVVLPFSILFEGERPTFHSLAGGAIAVAGVIALVLSR